MVVLAASIVTKTGKALVSRQYMDMSRIRIEGLLAAFPKLVGTGKQHTYVETENVRYVFQPMEGLYLLLVTNKQSNILEDLDTLRMLSKIVPEFAGAPEEDAICRAAFDLIFAFDEVIAQGHKENITVQQVKQNCEMESHEEKLHKMIIQSKINDTKDHMKRKAMEIEKTKMETRKMGGSDKAMGGFVSGGMSGFNAGPANARPPADDTPSFNAPSTNSSGSGARPAAKKGMQLGKSAKGAASILETLAKEGEAVELESSKPMMSSSAAAAAAAYTGEPVFINVEEKLFVTLNKEGGLENMEVQGTMSLVVKSEEDAFVKVAISSGANKGFQFKTHPNIDKGIYTSDNVLGLKDPSRPFPTGSELGILKWRMQTREEDMVPLTINCWPSVSGGESYVNIEYESNADYDLQNVTIAIPISSPPTVNQVDGDWRYDSRAHALLWTIDLIDNTNRSGSMEFVVPAADPEAFYPVEVSFTSPKTLCEVEIDAVLHSQEDSAVKYSSKKMLQTASYQVL